MAEGIAVGTLVDGICRMALDAKHGKPDADGFAKLIQVWHYIEDIHGDDAARQVALGLGVYLDAFTRYRQGITQTTQDRAAKVQLILDIFEDDEDDKTKAVDFMADMLHWGLERQGGDAENAEAFMEDIAGAAWGHHKAELVEEAMANGDEPIMPLDPPELRNEDPEDEEEDDEIIDEECPECGDGTRNIQETMGPNRVKGAWYCVNCGLIWGPPRAKDPDEIEMKELPMDNNAVEEL